MKKTWINSLFIFTCCIAFECASQSFLYVNHKKTYKYNVGDEITVMIDGYKTSGRIAFFTDSSFVFNRKKEIPLSQVEAIFRKNPRQKSINRIYTSAVLLPLIEIVNSGTPVSENVIGISTIIAASGFVIQLLHKRKVKIRSRSQLLIINSSLKGASTDKSQDSS